MACSYDFYKHQKQPLYLRPVVKEAQTVEHVTGWNNGLSQDYNKGVGTWFSEKPGAMQEVQEQFEPKPASEREVLIAKLREYDKCLVPVHRAAEMLAADAQEIERLNALYTNCTEAHDSTMARAMRAESKLAQQVEVPQGWELVPIEPTKEMLDAVDSNIKPHPTQPDTWRKNFTRIYKQMVAAPKASK